MTGYAEVSQTSLAAPPVESLAWDFPSVLTGLGEVTPPDDPAIVFTAIAAHVVPGMCDETYVALRQGHAAPHIVSFTLDDGEVRSTPPSVEFAEIVDRELCRGVAGNGGQRLTDSVVLTPIAVDLADDKRGYQGLLALRFTSTRPTVTHALLGQLLVERANAIVRSARLSSRAENLELALKTNRDIGAALGIIMSRHAITVDQAFDLLRRVSQCSHRKLYQVALDVIDTGVLEIPTSVQVVTPNPMSLAHRRIAS